MSEKTSSTGPAGGVRPGRRRLLQTLAGSVGAGLALPTVARSAETHGPAGGHARQAPAAPEAAPPAALPTFLDAHQRETLSTLAEAILPGANEAGVPLFVDQLLAVDSRDAQRDFLAAMGAVDAESIGRYQRPWTRLDASQRTEVLTAMSTASPSQPPIYWSSGHPEVSPGPSGPPTSRDRFDLVKKRVLEAYYSSEKGQRDLGWTGEVIHDGLPGCTHEGGHPRT